MGEFPRLLRRGRQREAHVNARTAAARQRTDALEHEYDLLRQDDRAYPPVMVALASAAALIGGTSVFFLLRGCGVATTDGCTAYPGQVYALLPAPSLAITALLVQQAVGATIRGRLLLAIETALSHQLRQEFRLGPGTAPIHSTYQAQQRVHHERQGALLWSIMFALPLVVLIGLIYYCGLKLGGVDRWIFYTGYALLVAIIAWAGLPVLRGYESLDTTIHADLQRRREQGRF